MNILSIDWDYFFPDISEFDWSTNESNSFMFEAIWPLRADNIGYVSKRTAIEHVQPRVLDILALAQLIDFSSFAAAAAGPPPGRTSTGWGLLRCSSFAAVERRLVLVTSC